MVALRLAALATLASLLGLEACKTASYQILLTQIPPSSRGGPDTHGILAGTVSPVPGDARIVVYTHAAKSWYVQPEIIQPFTSISKDGSWSLTTHLGRDYAALLVKNSHPPLGMRDTLPVVGQEGVLAIARATPAPAPNDEEFEPAPEKRAISFSGYDWNVRDTPSTNGGRQHQYSPRNVWVDDHGSLHLAIRKLGDGWSCGEVTTQRALSYGTYRFRVRDIGHFEPATMLSMNTWSDSSDEDGHHEIDLHVSRWGDVHSKNGEYVTQPYFLPANAYRFEIPSGPIIMSFRWEPEAIDLWTERDGHATAVVAPWRFTSNIPAPADVHAYLTLCVFGYPLVPQREETEVIIDQFQYLP